MTNTPKNRPALQRKTTRRSEQARRQEQSRALRIDVNGKQYTLRFGDVTGVEAKAFREQVGVPFTKIMRNDEDWDLDWIAGMVWLARRLDGERMLRFDDVAAEIGFDTEFDVSQAGVDVADGPVVEGEVVGSDPEG
jgi:phage tail tube protein FII